METVKNGGNFVELQAFSLYPTAKNKSVKSEKSSAEKRPTTSLEHGAPKNDLGSLRLSCPGLSRHHYRLVRGVATSAKKHLVVRQLKRGQGSYIDRINSRGDSNKSRRERMKHLLKIVKRGRKLHKLPQGNVWK